MKTRAISLLMVGLLVSPVLSVTRDDVNKQLMVIAGLMDDVYRNATPAEKVTLRQMKADLVKGQIVVLTTSEDDLPRISKKLELVEESLRGFQAERRTIPQQLQGNLEDRKFVAPIRQTRIRAGRIMIRLKLEQMAAAGTKREEEYKRLEQAIASELSLLMKDHSREQSFNQALGAVETFLAKQTVLAPSS